MYEYKLRGEHMTRVRCTFFAGPKKWTNCHKKKRVDCLRPRVLGLVVVVNSRVGLEGKEKLKKLSLRAFEVVGDRGHNTRQIVLRGANCKDSVRIASLFCQVFFVNKSCFFCRLLFGIA